MPRFLNEHTSHTGTYNQNHRRQVCKASDQQRQAEDADGLRIHQRTADELAHRVKDQHADTDPNPRKGILHSWDVGKIGQECGDDCDNHNGGEYDSQGCNDSPRHTGPVWRR